jgi:hypothetical protein
MTLATVFSRNSKIHSLRLEHDPKDETLIKSYLIVNRVEQQRQTFIDYTIRLQQVLNTYKRTASREVSSLSPTSISPTPSSPNSQPVLMSFDEQIYNLLLEGITLLGDWTSRVLDQVFKSSFAISISLLTNTSV